MKKIIFFIYLGFFPFKNDAEGSNLRGVYDQLMALKWINQNIADFGGDPTKVSLFGLDAGACSANLLAMVASNPDNTECNFSWVLFF